MLLPLLSALASAAGFLTSMTTCGDVRDAYASSACCGAPRDTNFTAVHTLKMGIQYGDRSNERVIASYMDEAVDRLTNGRLRIALAAGPKGTADLDDGSVDIVAMATTAATGNSVLSQVLTAGMASAGTGIDAAEMINFLAHGAGKPFHARAYHGTGYVGHVAGQVGPEIFGWSKTAIADLTAFSTMKMRVPGGLLAQAYQRINTHATPDPPPTTVSGIVSGTYDAWEWNSPYGDYTFLKGNAPATFDLRTSPYKHLYIAPLHQNSGIWDAVYKKTAFDAMPPDFRAALQTAATEAAYRAHLQRVKLNGPLVANMTAGADGWSVTIHATLPRDLTTAFLDAIDVTLAAATAGDADARAAVSAMREHAHATSAWRIATLRGEAELQEVAVAAMA